MSRNQVNRLVRIDALVPELKQQVDDKKLPFNTAVELSFLKPEEQGKVVDFMKKEPGLPLPVRRAAYRLFQGDIDRHRRGVSPWE